jgi:DNA-directed RNA polymerase I, II, and III subunit RPABC2
MSYFDKQNGGDASDDDKAETSDDSDTETETETIIDEEEEEDEEVQPLSEDDEDDNEDDNEDDDVAEGKEDEDEEGEEGAAADPTKPKEYDEEYDEEIEVVERKPKTKVKKIPTKQAVPAIVYDEEDEDDPIGEGYLQKFDKEINDNYLVKVHPESAVHNYDEILVMAMITRDKNGMIIDDLHKTIPFLTKYERARVLGQRAKQINSGATVFVKVPEKVIDGYLIAELELQEKRIPFIIRRPLPNGGSEYWSIKDLENISF